jgi:cytoskeleton protein RodZ
MTDDSPAPSPLRSAGTMLREARQAQGLHIAALAASIKVAQRKLEALEADRFEELPDATFTRALAQTVCRALKIDPVPVLALLPAPSGYRLEQVGGGINEPFRERPGRHEPQDWAVVASPAVWGPLLLVLGAAALYFLPANWLPSFQLAAPPASAPAAASAPYSPAVPAALPFPGDAASAAPGMQAPAIDLPASGPQATLPMPAASAPVAVPPPAAAASVALAPAASGGAILIVRTRAPSWLEVRDARSMVIESRMVQAGESLALEGLAPLRVKIGNASATEVVFRGRPLDLASSTRNNVARLELK